MQSNACCSLSLAQMHHSHEGLTQRYYNEASIMYLYLPTTTTITASVFPFRFLVSLSLPSWQHMHTSLGLILHPKWQVCVLYHHLHLPRFLSLPPWYRKETVTFLVSHPSGFVFRPFQIQSTQIKLILISFEEDSPPSTPTCEFMTSCKRGISINSILNYFQLWVLSFWNVKLCMLR